MCDIYIEVCLHRNNWICFCSKHAKFVLHCSPSQTTGPWIWQTTGSGQTLGRTPPPHPLRGKHLFQTGLEPFGTLRQMQKAQCLAQVCSAGELHWVAGRQPASGEQLEKLRLSYWHAGPGTQFCPETAVNRQPIAQQSGAGFSRRMLMRCNLLLSASCGRRFPSLLQQSDRPGSSLTAQLEIHLNHGEVTTVWITQLMQISAMMNLFGKTSAGCHLGVRWPLTDRPGEDEAQNAYSCRCVSSLFTPGWSVLVPKWQSTGKRYKHPLGLSWSAARHTGHSADPCKTTCEDTWTISWNMNQCLTATSCDDIFFF